MGLLGCGGSWSEFFILPPSLSSLSKLFLLIATPDSPQASQITAFASKITSSTSPVGLLASSYSSSIRGFSIRSPAAGQKSTSPPGELVSQHKSTAGYFQRPSPEHKQKFGGSPAASLLLLGTISPPGVHFRLELGYARRWGR